MNHFNLTGRTALVTGSAKGIGRAVVVEFLSLGAKVIASARCRESLEGLNRDLAHPNLLTVASDVATAEGQQVLIDAVVGRSFRLDVLVNNIGTNIRKTSADYAEGEAAQIWSTNVSSAFDLSGGLLPTLVDGSAVINIASVAGLTSFSSGVPCGVSKGALNHLICMLAVEWAPLGIRVNAVLPWFTRTPPVEPVLEKSEVGEAIAAATPLGRYAEPEEVAPLVAFLAMPAAGFISGQCIAPDGGFLAKAFDALAT